MFNENLKLVGHLDLVLTDTAGDIIDRREVDNLVVTAGKNFVASRMGGASADVMSHMAIGTGTTAAAAGDTTLATESARTTLTSTTVTDNDIVYVDTFAAGTGTGAITEAGVLNAGSGGTLLCRTVFSVINKGANDSLTITWTVTAS
jgi:hypothetical protein